MSSASNSETASDPENIETIAKTVVENIQQQMKISQEINSQMELGSTVSLKTIDMNEDNNTVSLVKIIVDRCDEKTWSTIVESGLVEVCIKALESQVFDPNFVAHFISVLYAVATLDMKTCRQIMDKNSFIIKNICKAYDTQTSEGKTVILQLFNEITNVGLSLDDHMFDQMFYKACAALSTTDNKLLLQSVNLLGQFIDLYQEQGVYAKLENYGYIPKLVTLLNSPDTEILLSTLDCLGGLLGDLNPTFDQCVIHGGILTYFPSLLLHEDNDVIESSLRTMSMISCGPKGSSKFLLDFNLLPIVLSHLRKKEEDIPTEAMHLLSTFYFSPSDDEVRRLTSNQELIIALVEHFSAKKSAIEGQKERDSYHLATLSYIFQKMMRYLRTSKESKSLPPAEGEETEEIFFTSEEIRTVLHMLKNAGFVKEISSWKNKAKYPFLYIVNDYLEILKDFKNLCTLYLS